MTTNTPAGKTRDTGFQVGVRKTLPADLNTVWHAVVSDRGLKLWLGAGRLPDLNPGSRFRLKDGTSGEIRVHQPFSHMRVTWKPADWPRPSTIQVRIIENGEKTTLAFHQEHLPHEQARDERKAFFKDVLEALASELP